MRDTWLRIFRDPNPEPTAGDAPVALEDAPPPAAQPAAPAADATEPFAGRKTARSAPAQETIDESEDAGAEPTAEEAAEPKPEAAEKPAAPAPKAKPAAEAEPFKVTPEVRADLSAFFTKGQIATAEKKGVAAVELLHSMALERIAEHDAIARGEDAPAAEPKAAAPAAAPVAEAKPEPKPEAKPVPKADATQAELADFTIPDEAIEELRSVIGDAATDKAIIPLTKAIAPLVQEARTQRQLNQKLYDFIVNVAQTNEHNAMQGIMDGWKDPQYGDTLADDLSPEQEKARTTLIARARAIFDHGQKTGEKITGQRALWQARQGLARASAKAEATREMQRTVRRRSASVNAVPGPGSHARPDGAAKGDDAAVSAVRARLREHGIHDSDG